MFILLGTYSRALNDGDAEMLAAHRAYLDECYRTGLLLASGPRVPRVGGLLVVRATDSAVAWSVSANSPLVRAELAAYEPNRFVATKAAHAADLEE